MWLIKRLTRHYKKNLLLILTVFVITVLFFISASIRENSASQIKSFLSTYKVTAYYMKRESYFSDRPGGAWLAPRVAKVPLKHEEYFQTYNLTRSLNIKAENTSSGKFEDVSVLGLTDLSMASRAVIAEAELVGYSKEDFKIDAKDAIALISTGLSESLEIAIGDEFIMTDDREESTAFKVCGIFESDLAEAVIPATKSESLYVINHNIVTESGMMRKSNNYDTCLYVLKDVNDVRDFKLAMAQEQDFRGARFVVDDGALNETIRPLKTTTDYMDSAIVILLVISVLIAFTVSFILLKSRSVEIAIMFCIGLPKIKIFLTLFAELAITTIFAILAGTLAGYIVSLNYIGTANMLETLNKLLLLFSALSLGAGISIFSSIAMKPMDILTKKEG